MCGVTDGAFAFCFALFNSREFFIKFVNRDTNLAKFYFVENSDAIFVYLVMVEVVIKVGADACLFCCA